MGRGARHPGRARADAEIRHAGRNEGHRRELFDDRIGKEVPNFTLTNQDGKHISPKDFRGKAWAITFIYGKCPLPDYCVRMSTNFSDLANQLKTDSDLKNKIALLSISFDPENDTPQKLRQYGAGYLGNQNPPDFSIWQLAVGTETEVKPVAQFFGLDYRRDENNNRQGKTKRQAWPTVSDGSRIVSGLSSARRDRLIASIHGSSVIERSTCTSAIPSA